MRALQIRVRGSTFWPIDRIETARPPSESIERILFWLLALTATIIACAALYYAAAARRVNAGDGSRDEASNAHLRLQLREIDADISAGRLNEAEAVAARAETAREALRLKREGQGGGNEMPRPFLFAAIAATAVVALGTYGLLGSPDLPADPPPVQAEDMTLEDAVARVERQLAVTPDDVRGWRAVAPIYMQTGRYEDAEGAYRRILELEDPTADAETDLAEAIMMRQEGSLLGEPLTLLTSAAGRDPEHVRSRFYLAGEATRIGEYQSAIRQWDALIALGQGDEPWIEVARDGLAAAEAGLNGAAPQPTADDIAAMVDGLAGRLESDGGSVAEWTQLVRSRLVLGQTELAQAAYDEARAAYPDAADRLELDVLAADNGLEAR